MELRDYAAGILEAETLDGKLRPPPAGLTDDEPGPACRVEGPKRPSELEIVRTRVGVPPPSGMPDPAQRARILHALANHELQAGELFAWALLAFPEMPGSFRRGCLKILADEQRHLRLYLDRLEALGGHFGDHPLTGHFWSKVASIETPLQFVCVMGLTFENANLDFAQELIEAARAAGDEATARVLAQVHDDEIGHVRFAWKWLLRLKDAEQPAWEAYCASVSWPHGPDRARGKTFDPESRLAAGLDPEFVRLLAETEPTRPGGARR